MRRMQHTRQISCEKCETKSVDVLEKKISESRDIQIIPKCNFLLCFLFPSKDCRGEARIHKQCIHDPLTGISYREIHIVTELPLNCTCSRSVQVTKEICGKLFFLVVMTNLQSIYG